MTSPATLALTLGSSLLIGCAAAIHWRSVVAGDAVANPTGGGGTVLLEPVPAKPATRRSRAIFVCGRARPVIFSDRPCGADFEERELKVEVPEPAAGRVASTTPAPARAETRPRPKPALDDDKPSAQDERCRALREEREKLDDHMRSGYTAREAARLWNRWRELNNEIFSARC